MLNKDDGIFLPSMEGVVSGKTSQVAGMNEIINNLIGNDNYLDKRKMSTENTIEDLKNSKKYKLGDVVEVLGFHTKGDGSHHKRVAKSENDGSGEQGQNGIWWCVVHSGEVNVSWFGVLNNSNASQIFKKLELLDCNTIDFNNFTLKGDILENGGVLFNVNKNIKNGVIILNPNPFTNYSVLDIKTSNIEISNIKVYGDIKVHTGTTGEWGHVLSIQKNVNDIVIKNSEFNEGWGDGVYIGPFALTEDEIPNRINFYDCKFLDSGRNNVSVISARNSNFTNCYFGVAERTLPKASIDLEPNTGYMGIYNVNLINCVGEGPFAAQVFADIDIKNINLIGCKFDAITARGVKTLLNISSSDIKTSMTIQNGATVNIDNSLFSENDGWYLKDSKLKISDSNINFTNTPNISTIELNNSVLEINDCIFNNVNRFNVSATTAESVIRLDNVEFYNIGFNLTSMFISSSKLSANSKIENCKFDVGTGTTNSIFDTTFAGYLGFNKYSSVYYQYLDKENIKYVKKSLSSSLTITSENELIDAIVNGENGITTFDATGSFSQSCGYISNRSNAGTSSRNGSYAIIGGGNINYPSMTVYFLKNFSTKEFIKKTITLADTYQLLDTPYYTRKMEEQGIYSDYIAYRDELHEYENSQTTDETMLLPVLQEPEIPESIKAFAEKYKLI